MRHYESEGTYEDIVLFCLHLNGKTGKKHVNQNWGKLEQIKNPTFTLLDYNIFKDDDDLIDDFVIKGQHVKKTIDANKYSMNSFHQFLENEKRQDEKTVHRDGMQRYDAET